MNEIKNAIFPCRKRLANLVRLECLAVPTCIALSTVCSIVTEKNSQVSSQEKLLHLFPFSQHFSSASPAYSIRSQGNRHFCPSNRSRKKETSRINTQNHSHETFFMFSSHTLLCASPAASQLHQTAAGRPREKQKKNKRKTQKQLCLLSAQFILSVCLVLAYALACLIERSVNQCEGTLLLASRVSFYFIFFRPNAF
jgi:hypothetical protein